MRVTLIAAQSVDGYITRHDEPGTAFTSAADQHYFREALRSFDCSIMGGETYRVSRDQWGSQLSSERCRVVLTRDPGRYAAESRPGKLEFSKEPPAELVQRLRDAGHQACALLGGAQIHHLFLEAGLVDELWLTLEPRLFGTGTRLVGRAVDLHLQLESVERLDHSSTLLAKYRLESTCSWPR
jgi:dihydrofolate reductase